MTRTNRISLEQEEMIKTLKAEIDGLNKSNAEIDRKNH